MTTKALPITVATLALAAASSVFAADDGEPKLPRSIDPNIPSADYVVALLEVDHTLDTSALKKLAGQLNKQSGTSLETAAKAIAGNGGFKVMWKPASFSVVEGQPFPLQQLEGVEIKMPINDGKGLDGLPVHAEVGYRLDVDAIQIDTAHGKVETTFQIRHSAVGDAGGVATVIRKDKDTMSVGDVHIMAWVLSGKQYAMAIKAERFTLN